MAQRCYLCNAGIPGQGNRRWVQTSLGSYGRVYVSRRGLSGSSTNGGRTGLRTICDDCAISIDANNARSEHRSQVLFECLAIIVVGFFLVSMFKEQPKPYQPPLPSHIAASTTGDP